MFSKLWTTQWKKKEKKIAIKEIISYGNGKHVKCFLKCEICVKNAQKTIQRKTSKTENIFSIKKLKKSILVQLTLKSIKTERKNIKEFSTLILVTY